MRVLKVVILLAVMVEYLCVISQQYTLTFTPAIMYVFEKLHCMKLRKEIKLYEQLSYWDHMGGVK